MICKYFLLSSRLLFHSVGDFHCCPEDFWFDIDPLVLVWLLLPLLFVSDSKNDCQGASCPCFLLGVLLFQVLHSSL